ncbi:MAG TPA: ester cyclase [Thermoanaerobaculia bacterium]|nr:ester cyclase [Thermoanaerobaculia bacterium]
MRRLPAFALLLLLASTLGAHAKPRANAADATMKKYIAMWAGGDVSLADEVFDAKIVRHHPPSIQPPEISGLEAYKMYIAAFRQMHPDLKFEVMDTVASKDMVAFRYSASAMNPATQKRFTFGGLALSKLGADGKIVEEWVTWDTYDLMAQVGLVEPRKK